MVVKLGGRKEGLAAVIDPTVPPLLKPVSQRLIGGGGDLEEAAGAPGVIFPPLDEKAVYHGSIAGHQIGHLSGKGVAEESEAAAHYGIAALCGRPGETKARLPDDQRRIREGLVQVRANHLVVGDVRIVHQRIERRYQIGEAVHLAYGIGVMVRP